MAEKFYLTTTTPYVNAAPHIGFALELIQADVVVRYHALLGEEVFFNTGTDEHGLKIYRKALEAGVPTQAYVDKHAEKFRDLVRTLALWEGITFIRTTDPHHKQAAQAFWQRCLDNGDIYKKDYQVKYCVGCEMEKTDSELEDNKCPLHPSYEIERIDEENYFFRFSKYQQPLLDLYAERPDFVIPQHRGNEIKAFVERGLEDFSISRLKAKMPWGVDVPNDPEHVMYVWFDALVNYISTVGWPEDEDCGGFWPGLQVAGKDNLRQQTAMWQAMLLSAGIPNSKQVFIHGFITSEGKKMSKSLGNVVDPYAVVDKYGIDAVRYYLLGALPSYDDGDFSTDRFEEYYTAHLVNGVGNLASRILSMLEKYSGSAVPEPAEDCFDLPAFWQHYEACINEFKFDALVEHINTLVARCDELISKEKPWERAAAGEEIGPLLYQLTETLRHIGLSLLPVIPTAAKQLLGQLGITIETLPALKEAQNWGKLPKGAILRKTSILFPRLSGTKERD